LSLNKFVFIVGSTATGKSAWALDFCEKHQAEIINCDSVHLYTDLNIGAAKPSMSEQQRVRHHLLGYVPAPKVITAGQYYRDFFALAPSLTRPQFVVGGTGFYFQALERGMFEVAPAPQELKQQVDQELQKPGGPERLWAELEAKDPQYVAKLARADLYRLGRAIEIIRHEGRSVTEVRAEFEAQQKPFPFPLLKIGVAQEKDELTRRILLRTEQMLASGLVEEVEALLARGLRDWPPLSSVGYKEVVEFLDLGQSREWLKDAICVNTWQLAKKQKTWFQRDREIQWYSGVSGFSAAARKVEEFLTLV